MSVQGDLKDLELLEIIQLNCRSKQNARVTVENGQRDGTLYFAGGNVIHATYENLSGEEAVYQLLGWQEGHFIIDRGVNSPQKTIQIPWSALLLQAMKYLDEKRSQAEQEKRRADDAKADTLLEELADRLIGVIAIQVADAQGSVADLIVDDTFEKDKTTALAHIVEQAGKTLEMIEAGSFVETITTTEKYRFIIRPIDQSHYYIRIILQSDGSVGAARMYLADMEDDLLGILPT